MRRPLASNSGSSRRVGWPAPEQPIGQKMWGDLALSPPGCRRRRWPMRSLVFFVALLASSALAADWTVGPAPSDDPSMTAAIVRNEDGHVLFLWGREADSRYQVFAEL